MANKKITDLMSGTPVRDSLLESAIDISGTMDSRKVKAGVVADLASANVAAPYDTTVTYAIGQYCLYEGDIYRCIAITTGAFDSTAWTQIVVTGEFRRVVELTSAQYTALSSAEKNNGTLYIITDEETTAADIPYSQGVSVADKLGELNDIKNQIHTVNLNTMDIANGASLVIHGQRGFVIGNKNESGGNGIAYSFHQGQSFISKAIGTATGLTITRNGDTGDITITNNTGAYFLGIVIWY